MKKKVKDRHLDLPSEANRDKHINFLALEKNEEDPANAPATGKLADSPQETDGKRSDARKKKNHH